MRARRAIAVSLGSVASAVCLVGLLHMPFARGFLMKVGGCPVGNASLAEVEPARNAAVRAARGTTPAPARPALGFELDRTRHDDVVAWADRNRVSCHEERESLTFCKDVPGAALGIPDADGPVSEVHFGFNTRGVLVDLATMRMNATPRPAIAVKERLAAAVGAPQEEKGGFDEATLARPVSTLSYKYSDYMAEVIAMRFPAQGLVVREHYLSARD